MNFSKFTLTCTVFILIFGSTACVPYRPESSVQTAPDFTLANPRGENVTLSSFQGLPVVLNFFTTWCGYCRQEMPDLQALHQRHARQGLVIIGIDVEETASQAASYAREIGISFPLLVDSKGKVANQYQVNSFPRTFFISPTGEILHEHAGTISASDLSAYIDELLALPRQPTATPTAPYKMNEQKSGAALTGCVNIQTITIRTSPNKKAKAAFSHARDTCMMFDARSVNGTWLRLADQVAPDGSRLWADAQYIRLEGSVDNLPVSE